MSVAAVDYARYPLDAPGSQGYRVVTGRLRAQLAGRGVAILPGFLTPGAVRAMAGEVAAMLPGAHRQDATGTPYLGAPDPAFPPGHPRRTEVRSRTWVVAYDRVPADAAIRALYEWDGLMGFVADVLDRRPLYRYADPFGALNVTSMVEGDAQGWHYDATEFVVSLAIQASDAGGELECVVDCRDDHDEHAARTARVLAGDRDGVEVLPMTPGTLMIFKGRNSLHRVSPIQGSTPRYVALLSYDTHPGADSSDALKLMRYGRLP